MFPHNFLHFHFSNSPLSFHLSSYSNFHLSFTLSFLSFFLDYSFPSSFSSLRSFSSLKSILPHTISKSTLEEKSKSIQPQEQPLNTGLQQHWWLKSYRSSSSHPSKVSLLRHHVQSACLKPRQKSKLTSQSVLVMTLTSDGRQMRAMCQQCPR